MVKKPVIDVDDVTDAGDEAPSLAADIASSSFALWNVANALVTESAAVQATFIQFQDTLAESLNRLTEFIVKEQAEARENWHAVLGLLQWPISAVEGAPSVQTETILAGAEGNAEAGPSAAVGYVETVDAESVAGLIRWAWTPLFLLSDENTEPSNESYVDEVKGSSSSSKEGSTEGSEDWRRMRRRPTRWM
jgi:hypothetical protein